MCEYWTKSRSTEFTFYVIPPEKYTILPNTAGCFDADSAVRTCMLARELLDGHNLVKLEVLGDEKTLYPNVTETLKAARTLIDDGFEIMVYTSDDPIIAQELESMGCVAIMPLAKRGWCSDLRPHLPHHAQYKS